MIAQGQKTIVDLADPIQQGTAPANPVEGLLWLDTSQSPPQLKRWSGTEWELVNEVSIGGTNLILGSEEIIIEADTNNYNYRSLYSPLEQGEKYTVSVESIILNEGTATDVSLRLYDLAAGVNGGSVGVFQISSERQSLTFTPSVSAGNTWGLLLYAGRAGETSGVGITVNRIKLERGSIATDWSPAPDDALQGVELQLADTRSQISSTATAIRQEVEANYALSSDLSTVAARLNTVAEQTDSGFTWTTSQLALLQGDLSEKQDALEGLSDIISYMHFGANGLTIGRDGDPVSILISNDRMSFLVNGGPVAYFSDNKLYVESGEFLGS